MSKKIYHVKLHSSPYLPGIGELTTTVPPSGKTLEDLDMRFSPEGILLTCKYKGIKKSAILPWANVQIASYVEEAETPAPVKTPEKA